MNSGRLFEEYRKAFLIRAVEQRLLDLFSEGKLFGTIHTCIGQEWTGVAVAAQLRDGDYVVSNHRGHGHFLATTGDVDGLIAEVMGKRSGVVGGRGGSQHLWRSGFLSSGILAGMTPVAVGLAFSQKLRKSSNITVVFVGDGTLSEGVLYESMNLASLHELPLLIVLENNYYAQSTPQKQFLAGDILERVHAFGIETHRADTWDPEQLMGAAQGAVGNVRALSAPTCLVVDTYRLMAHSKGDDDREPSEVESYRAKDPLVVFAKEQKSEAQRIERDVNAVVDRAVTRAESSPYPDLTLDSVAKKAEVCDWSPSVIRSQGRVVNLIHDALRRAMDRDSCVILLGEDIEAPYGGAFKVTRDLSEEFPDRVKNMPVSEAGIVGMASGLAMAGFLPVCEIMFGDFMLLAADQIINHAAKFADMYNGQTRVPLVIRTPMGGRRGYGPTHSQSLEKHFLGVPGIRVLAPNPMQDVRAVYDTLLETIDAPTIVIENKLLYGLTVSGDQIPSGFLLEHDGAQFPTSRMRPGRSPEVTVLCYGGMVPEAKNAAVSLFEDEEILCEVIFPTQLYPLDLAPILDSLSRTGTLLVAEEGQIFAAFGSEVIAQISETTPGLVSRVRRVGPSRSVIASSRPVEEQQLPTSEHIVEAAVELLRDAG